MSSLIRPIGLLVTFLLLSLFFTNAALAFECTNAGAGATAPDDGDVDIQTACGDAAVASGTAGTAVGGSALASGPGSTALGTGADATGTNSTAVGWAADAINDNSTAVGKAATASGILGTALGKDASASGSQSTALGASVSATESSATAVGFAALATGSASTALGRQAEASGGQSTAAGRGATASGTNNTTLGYNASALSPYSNATALGFQAMVEQSNALVLGSIPGVNEPFFLNEYVDVGIGTTMPQAPLHVERANGAARVLVMETDPGPSMPFQGVAQGLVRFELNDEAAGERWRFTNAGDKFAINNVGLDSPGTEMSVFKNGDLVIGGLLTENSDRDAKQDIERLDAQEILAKIVDLEVSKWSYIDAPKQRHIGPMAQDFHSAFGLGRDNKHIATLDTSGVALAGIQALAEENHRLNQENQALNERLGRLESQQARLQEVVLQMQEEQRARQVLSSTALN
jgi:hypothetical protein